MDNAKISKRLRRASKKLRYLHEDTSGTGVINKYDRQWLEIAARYLRRIAALVETGYNRKVERDVRVMRKKNG